MNQCVECGCLYYDDTLVKFYSGKCDICTSPQIEVYEWNSEVNGGFDLVVETTQD